jgi:hypothetical protein
MIYCTVPTDLTVSFRAGVREICAILSHHTSHHDKM